MTEYQETIDDFLAHKRIAIAGVSRNPQETANFIYRALRDAGYEVLAVNPNASEAEGDPCYPDLASIPDGVDGVLVVTRERIKS
jgi:predicted CoA-binding protein